MRKMQMGGFLKKITVFLVSLVLVSSFLGGARLVMASAASQAALGGAAAAGSTTYGTGNPVDIRVTAANYIRFALGLLGIIFVVLVVWAGFKYMTADGKGETTKEAVATIQRATVGLLIILAAYALTSFIISSMVAATNQGQ